MEPEKKQKKISLGRLLVLCIACGVFLYSGAQLWAYVAENKASKDSGQELIDQAVVAVTPKPTQPPATEVPGESMSEETVPPETEPVETAPIYVDFEVLKAQNEDIVGWIYSEGTKINYPILQGDSNQQYLYLLYTGEYNANGSIFMDFRNLPDFSDHNNLIYGHNMAHEVMFGSLNNYKNQEYYEAHPVMWILTPDKAFRVDLIAGMVTPSDSDTYDIFSYVEDLQARMEYAISQSTFDAGEIDISSIEHVVTLSTCTYDFVTARYVVIGNLVEVAYPEPPESTEPTEP